MTTEWDLVVGLLTLGVVLTGLVLMLSQLRVHDQRRKDAATMAILAIAQDPKFGEDLSMLDGLPDDAPGDLLRADANLWPAVGRISYRNESLGIMVFERLADLHTMDRMAGGSVRLAWRKLRRFIQEERDADKANYLEWFEWLANQLDRDPAPGKKEGAHNYFKEWKPRKP